MIWGATETIAIDNVQLACQSWGPSPDEAPTLVLLHEGLGCVELWREFPNALAAATGCGVFAYSRAGYGWSDPANLPRSTDYLTQEAVDVLPKVLDAIGAHRYILVGHSDGATIAAIYAGSVIDARVRGLALMAPHFYTEEKGLDAIAQAKTAFAGGSLREKIAKYHRDVDATFHGWCEAWLDPARENWDVSEVIDYLRIPTLAIQGVEDAYGTYAQIDEIAERSYAPVEVACFADCGHAPHIDQPEKTTDTVVGFVRRLIRIEQEDVKVA